ncbi:MAG: T9SS type A sorting domain-containing protein [Bacteroidota bacterium]
MKNKLPFLLMAAFCFVFSTRSFADVTLSSEVVAASNASQGSTNNILYIVKMDVTTTTVTTSTIQFILTGTHDNNDLDNVRVFTNTTATLTGATNRGSLGAGFAAPHTYNINYNDFSITAGSTLYFIITGDVNATGTSGNTFKLDGAVNPVVFTYTTPPVTVNNQTDAGGSKTIQAATVDYSSVAVAGGNVSQSSTDNIAYIVKVDVGVLPVTSGAIQFTLTGTHDANDLDNVRVYTNATPTLSGAVNRGSLGAGFVSPHTYSINYNDFSISAGNTLYFIITFDVNATGTSGNTIKINGVANPVTFTYTTGPTITNNQTDVTGIKTIQVATVDYSSVAVAGGNVSQSSTDNIAYIVKVDVGVLPVTSGSIQFTLTGTHDANDLDNVRVHTNATPNLSGAVNRGSLGAGFVAPHTYSINYNDFSISAGTTLYFIITFDVNATGTSGNTIKINGVANPVTFTYTTGPTITNNQTDVTGIKTIQVATVDYSSVAVAGGNVSQSSTDNIAYIVKVDVGVLPVTSGSIQFTLTGTHDANDLDNVRVHTNATPNLSGAVNRGSLGAGFVAPHTYSINYNDFSITAGTTLYFIITFDVDATATGGNTIKIDGQANPVTFTYTTGPTITNNQTDVTGIKTIQVATVDYSSVAVAGGNVSQSSTDNIAYIVKVDVGVLPVTSGSIQFTLTGTHDANDLDNVRVYTNATPTLSGAVNRGSLGAGFVAPHTYSINYNDFGITAGTTLYFIITFDVDATATGGNTIKIDGQANPVTFTYTTGPTITNVQTDIAGLKTVQVAGVTYSSVAVTAGNTPQASNDNIVYIVKVDITDLPVTSASIQFTLTGTHDANDLDNVRVYTNTNPTLTGAANRGSLGAGFAAPHVYNINYNDFGITPGSTLYFIITADINAAGTNGNTIKLDGAANPVTFSYTTAPPVTNNQTDAAGLKTIQAPGIVISSEPVAAANMLPASNNNIVYIAKVDVAGLPVTTSNLALTLTGTHDNDDLTSITIYTNTAPNLSGATNRGAISANFAAPHIYNINYNDFSIAAGVTLYFLVTVDVGAAATIGNTVKIDGAANPVVLSYTTAPTITNNQTDAAGAKTIATSLPLTLLSFAANLSAGSQVSLFWETVGEINTKQFEVQWSSDGSNFSSVGIVAAAGTSPVNKQYAYQHPSPLSGNNFYRLKMIDKDGHFTYSPVVKIVVTSVKGGIVIYPNPVKGLLRANIHAIENKQVLLGLYDISGKMVASKSIFLAAGNNQVVWPVQELAAGNYMLKMSDKAAEAIKVMIVK